MFGFMDMVGNYDQRKIGRHDGADFFISTCSVTDSAAGFETAVKHPQYNNDTIIIVEEYTSKAKAEKGHAQWVKLMTAKKLPDQLMDVSKCEIAEICNAVGATVNTAYKKKLKT